MKIKHCALTGALIACVLLSGCASVNSYRVESFLKPIAAKLPEPNPPVTDYRQSVLEGKGRDLVMNMVLIRGRWLHPGSVQFDTMYTRPVKEYQGKIEYVCGNVKAKNRIGSYGRVLTFFIATRADYSYSYAFAVDDELNGMMGTDICRKLMRDPK